MFFEKSRIAASTIVRLSMALVILLAPVIAKAGAITIDEAGVNAIFSQESFGDTPVSVRFNPPETIVAPQYLVINTLADLQGLYSLVPNPFPTIAAFFVDTIRACGQVDVSDDGSDYGCAQLPGNFQVLNSKKAVEFPAKLMAHELGHNFGLEHTSLGLMTSRLEFGGTELFEDQVEEILESPLVQIDANGQRFIQVQPIAIVGTPEPSTLLLLSSGLGAMLSIKKKKSPGTRP
jgi:Metallo-peptidase family M12B Reprolysin-like